MEVLSGKIASNGIGIGKICKLNAIKEPTRGMVLNVDEEILKLDDNLKDLRNELKSFMSKYSHSELFKKLYDAASDEEWIKQIKLYIKQMSMNVEYSIKKVSEKMGDYYLDNAYRFIRIINEFDTLEFDFEEDTVIFIEKITMSDALRINDKYVKAIVTSDNIIGNNKLTIPYIYGIDIKKIDGTNAIVDADKGIVLLDQTKDIITKYKQQIQINNIRQGGLTKYIGVETKTKDLRKVELSGILDKVSDIELIKSNDCDSSVILDDTIFYNEENLIGESLQLDIYKKIFDVTQSRILNLNLKFYKNNNFYKRLKPVILATNYGKINITLSNITNINDIDDINKAINSVEQELIKQNIQFKKYNIGLNIENIEQALNSKNYIDKVDYFVIDAKKILKCIYGSNVSDDLMYYNNIFFSIVRKVSKNVYASNKYLGIYLDENQKIEYILNLIGLGVDKFFIKPEKTLIFRKNIVNYEKKHLIEYARRLMSIVDKNEIEKYLGGII